MIIHTDRDMNYATIKYDDGEMHRTSCGMLKHPPPGRVRARKGCDVCSMALHGTSLVITEIAQKREINLSPIS